MTLTDGTELSSPGHRPVHREDPGDGRAVHHLTLTFTTISVAAPHGLRRSVRLSQLPLLVSTCHLQGRRDLRTHGRKITARIAGRT
ncbi:hypothetical protein ACFW5D_36665 [Streptomyces sp. NPDC058770]|uniref:hypothetical protein n=1 Tax=Streptomyces sp. NPDC058770 TaxID=3346631 RepID=UPI0036BA72B4